MTTGRSRNAEPMDPMYIISFFSKKKMDQITINCMVKALKKYHKATSKAAKILDDELKKCQKKSVRVKKPLHKNKL